MLLAAFKVDYNNDPDAARRMTRVLVEALAAQTPGWEGGSITVLRPDGTEHAFSPIFGCGIAGPWAVSVDGNDDIWIDNLTTPSAGIVHLSGFLVEDLPAGDADRRRDLAAHRLCRRRPAGSRSISASALLAMSR